MSLDTLTRLRVLSNNKFKLRQGSGERLATLIGKYIVPNVGHIHGVLDIGCGDGALSHELDKHVEYTGVDIADCRIYEKSTDNRISYVSPGKVENFIERQTSKFDIACLLDVLEHTIEFDGLALLCAQKGIEYIIISLPNELFIYDRIRFLQGIELPAHALDLRSLPAGFKHQYIINIDKARTVLDTSLAKHGYSLEFEVFRELKPKNLMFRLPMMILAKVTKPTLWSMGSIFVFRKRQ